VIVVHLAGFADSGKTTLACRVLQAAAAEGHRVAYIKHHHDRLERPGSDTDRAHAAGATLCVLAGTDGTLWLDRPHALAEILVAAKAHGSTLAIVEGFKGAPGPKCWLRRSSEDAPPPEVADVALDLTPDEAQGLEDTEILRRLPAYEV